MSNSIWKTPDQKPDTDQHVLFFAGGGIFPYLGFYYPKFDTFDDWESKDVQRWASVFEVIAQADKAERLRKALDVAIERLNLMSRETFQGEPSSINMGFRVRAEAALADIDEIIAEQKDEQ